MIIEAKIIKVGNQNDYVAISSNGENEIILENSRIFKLDYYREMLIYSVETERGVNYSREYEPADIEDIINKKYKSKISSYVVYENSDIVPYHFIAISKTRDECEGIVKKLEEWGFRESRGYVKDEYRGKNGYFGISRHVNGDFRPKVRDKPKQDGIKFIPLEGLVSPQGESSIYIRENVIKRCVEALPNLIKTIN